MNTIDIPFIGYIPEKYRGMVILAILLFPYATRAYYALANGGGLVGACRSILWGTNTPKAPTPSPSGEGNTPKLPIWLLLGLLALVPACSTTPYRAAFNTLDSIESAVTAAERVWIRYRVQEAKAELIAAGNAAPTAADIEAAVLARPDAQRLERLDTDYRSAAGALAQAAATAQALKAAGGSGALDPAWQQRALASANALIAAISEITNTKLKEAQ